MKRFSILCLFFLVMILSYPDISHSDDNESGRKLFEIAGAISDKSDPSILIYSRLGGFQRSYSSVAFFWCRARMSRMDEEESLSCTGQ